jgi:crotonobetainyl-CoA:carnitine CoA-transferase CaiB-like acyl-CoA transferase
VTADEVAATRPGFGALRGLRVLDLSRVLAGPYCAQMLGDHGAEVIKVEAPDGDDTRTWGPYLPSGASTYFESINRNKRNICLNLATDPGRQALAALIDVSDVVIENFKIGTMSRWGFGYEETLAERYPALIYCRITGYGTDGPLGGLPGYDAALQAYGGLMSINGEADRDPMRIGVPVVDAVTGIFAFAGILLALNERATSGRGQLVDCTLLDTSISLLHPHSGGWLGNGVLPVRSGAAHPSIAPYETFQAADGLLFISAANDRQFDSLVDVLGRPDLADDERFATNLARLNNVAGIRECLGPLIAEWNSEPLSAALLSRGVAASPVHDVAQALTSAQVLSREMVVSLANGYRGVGIPVKLGRTPGQVARAPVGQGADTRSVLRELGFDASAIEAVMRTSGPGRFAD